MSFCIQKRFDVLFLLYYHTAVSYGVPTAILNLRNKKNRAIKKFTPNFTNILLAWIEELQTLYLIMKLANFQ